MPLVYTILSIPPEKIRKSEGGGRGEEKQKETCVSFFFLREV